MKYKMKNKTITNEACCISYESDYKAMALECLHALRLLNAHYTDLSKSNPSFMGKLCLQEYDLWNKALLASECALTKYANIPNLS